MGNPLLRKVGGGKQVEDYEGGRIIYLTRYPSFGGGHEVYWSVDRPSEKGLHHNAGTGKTLKDAQTAAHAFIDKVQQQ